MRANGHGNSVTPSSSDRAEPCPQGSEEVSNDFCDLPAGPVARRSPTDVPLLRT